MTSALDFPNNCSTNVYTLNDFGEIAYIVCSVATRASHDTASWSLTPENIIDRLRRTERQFREASILAALDVEAHQLFTFYKKVDIANAKDQKALLSKFGFVLRSNTCTIAYKTAARLPDLIKPEHARLYRLFTTAVVSSIKLLPNGDSALQPVGLNIYLVERAASEGLTHIESIRKWDLYRIDLHVIPSGHVILTIVRDEQVSFVRMLELGQDSIRLQHLTQEPTAVYLAPVGRIARLIGPGVETDLGHTATNPGDVVNGVRTLDVRKELWKELLPAWLKENMNMAFDDKELPWIHVELPVQQVEGNSTAVENDSKSDDAYEDSIIWRPVFWPAKLSFVINGDKHNGTSTPSGGEDPMQFVQDWLTGPGKRPGSTIKGERTNPDAMEDDDEPLFVEDGAFGDPEQFQSFGPPAFSSSQAIYPTPPDAVMTHPTPGLSSLDAIAMTPANIARRPSEMAQPQDSEMHDFEEGPGPGGLSRFYDEDLFEEMPDDHFGQEVNGDEPNWDFFDRPGVDSRSTPMATTNRSEMFATSTGLQEGAMESRFRSVNDDDVMPLEHRSNSPGDIGPVSTIKMPEGEMENQEITPNAEKRRSFPHRSNNKESPQTSPRFQGSGAGHNGEEEAQSPKISSRRRSSFYGAIRQASTISDRDSKYTADGDYWFDPNPAAYQSKPLSTPKTIFQRPSSSPSESDSSLDSPNSSSPADYYGSDSAALPRQWIEYETQSQDTINNLDERIGGSPSQEVQDLLSLLKPGLIEPPSISDFVLRDGLHLHSTVSASELSQIAHILVEQVSQTTLNIPDLQVDQSAEGLEEHFDVSIDLSGINTSTQPASVSQLVNLEADSTGPKSQGKVVKLPPSQVCVQRADQPLVAAPSILDFWDTLNLQPGNGAKAATAFCVHPNARNIADGCLNLLQRMTDTYNSCSLGLHSTGRLSGVTDDGLIVWDRKSTSRSDLHQTCRKVGSALATASNIKGTAIIYMISQDRSAASYLEACQAFCSLFESFRQALGDREDVFDIALQVIPQDFVASPDTLVIPPQSAYIRLAIEVYNRLPPPDLTEPQAASGSAIVLAKVDTSVHFRLSPTFTSPLSYNGPCLHLAYSASVDDRWICATWTDELGQVALMMSYCTRVCNASHKRPKSEIFREMWEISHDIMGRVHSSWRLAVVKQGYYESADLLDWKQIIDNPSNSQRQCVAMLLSVQLHPELKVFPPPAQAKTGQVGLQNTYGTPASTPQASITSPDQLIAATPTPGGSSIVNAPTPSEPGFDPNIESDLTLVDPTEESWGVILPYGVNQTTSMVGLQPALVTGLLLKRKGSKIEDGCTAIEVSLISISAPTTESSSENPEEVLEDLLTQYRGLVTLAATRGCIDPLRESVPWHIATSVRGSRVLGDVL
ncbi:hypothetical protein A1O1_03985 [Capronia coronata CBS 617.96]|uniref:Mediator of RNA polymerase II transcription subunit 13 n=1 Tax=Capronia coronata CBS 617.96 TaxID=1182541 RepID=W9Z8R1_9EURO|nr:uncharacterized protein A1O1_03985 [Capronia coronata CBS 617.96]EXJ90879.1 hypothetical protein A1O1_03985 [Capronia coronata CBS 617.96]